MPKRSLLRYIGVIKFFMTIMTPVIFIINLFSRGLYDAPESRSFCGQKKYD